MKKVSGTLSAEHPRLFKPVPFAFFLASPDGTITTEKWAQSPACVHEEKLERNEGYWQFDFHCNADSFARQAKGDPYRPQIGNACRTQAEAGRTGAKTADRQ